MWIANQIPIVILSSVTTESQSNSDDLIAPVPAIVVVTC